MASDAEKFPFDVIMHICVSDLGELIPVLFNWFYDKLFAFSELNHDPH